MSRFLPRSSARHSSLILFFFTLLLAFTVLPLTARAASPAHISLRLDVPFVPTPPDVVDKMLGMADITSSDFLIDLGAGDGRIAVAAVRDYGAKGAFGVDIDPERVQEARANAEQAGVADKVRFEIQDLFDTDFSQATVLSMYLLPDVNVKLRPKVLEMTPGTRVVSHQFDMAEWEPDAYARVDNRDVYFWVVPAKIGGQWQFTGPDGDFTVDLKQSFQKVTGTAAESGKASLPIVGTLRGDLVQLDIDGGGAAPQRYVGRVQGDSIAAVAVAGAVRDWRASKR